MLKNLRKLWTKHEGKKQESTQRETVKETRESALLHIHAVWVMSLEIGSSED